METRWKDKVGRREGKGEGRGWLVEGEEVRVGGRGRPGEEVGAGVKG